MTKAVNGVKRRASALLTPAIQCEFEDPLKIQNINFDLHGYHRLVWRRLAQLRVAELCPHINNRNWKTSNETLTARI